MEQIKFGNSLPGYVAGDASAPGVVVLQEWWGITPEIKTDAQLLASKGYRVLLPDLYKGKIGVDMEEAHHLMDNLDFPGAVQEIKQAVQYLRDGGAPKVAVVGFCMGGSLALAAAQHAGVDTAVAFYGTPPAQLAQPEAIRVPVQLHSGDQDSMKGFSDKETVEAFVEEVKAAGGNIEYHQYAGEGHAFMNAQEDSHKRMKTASLPEGRKETQELAWSRVFEYLGKQLS